MLVNPPQRVYPDETWEHNELYFQVRESLIHITDDFKSVIEIKGVNATEIYAFSAVLGLTIEHEIIRTLNNLRNEWDSHGKYVDYRFVRQAQTFPDVLLMNDTGLIIMGIELKSWYLLAKEREPSFRYQVTPNACTPQDLVVIIPWVLSNVLSGNPIVFSPYIENARYVAEYRNYWWQHIRNARSSTRIISAENVTPYPAAKSKIVDEPERDTGNNFGRIARTGLIDDYINYFQSEVLAGIRVDAWQAFLKQQIDRRNL